MKKKLTTFAAIHLGSEAVSMQIVEYSGLDKVKVLEEANQTVKLGEEAFAHHKISFSTVMQVCEILKGYKRLMEEYGVQEYALQATTAVREAENQAYFLDQVKVKTGLTIEVIDMPREIYTRFVSITETLRQYESQVTAEGVLFVDTSSGGLGITYMVGGKIKYQQNLHIGVIRIKEQFDRNQRSSISFGNALTEYISSNIGPVRQALRSKEVKYLVLSGAEIRLFLQMLKKSSQGKKAVRLKAADFTSFYEKVRKLNMPQIIKLFNLEENFAELVLPTIVLYQQLLGLTPVEDIIAVQDRFIDGMKLLHIAQKTNKEFLERLENLRMSLVHSIGERYEYDVDHVNRVEKFALAIFDSLKKSQGLDDKSRLLLRVAAILHDIGKYICLRSHSVYSYDLIMATDILGFSNLDKRIVALASYYQAYLLFETQPADTPQVSKENLPLVAKLAAILRLADAMDRSYKQKIRSCKVTVKGNELLIMVKSKQDLALEEWTFANKGNFFEEVFGLLPILERANG